MAQRPEKQERKQERRDEKEAEKLKNEQRKAELVEAYRVLEAQEDSLKAQIAALEGRTPRTPDQEAALQALNDRLKTNSIDKSILDREMREIGFRADEASLEELVRQLNGLSARIGAQAGSGAVETLETLATGQTAAAKACEALALNNLIPADLKAGDNILRAAKLVLTPALFADLTASLPKVGSPDYPAELQKLGQQLTGIADSLQPIFEQWKTLRDAAEDMGAGVIAKPTVDAIKDLSKNPRNMLGAAAGVAGLAALLYFFVGKPQEGAQKWIVGILGGLGVAAGGLTAWDALKRNGVGGMDQLEDLTGINTDQLFSTEAMDRVREMFKKWTPSEDTDQVDNFILSVDSKVRTIVPLFKAGLRGARSIDPTALLGNGLSTREEKMVEDKPLFEGYRSYFIHLYNKALAKGKISPTKGEDAQADAGADYFLSKYPDNLVMTGVLGEGDEMMSPAGAGSVGEMTASSSERLPAGLSSLKSMTGFGEYIKDSSVSGVVLIKGYPYKYDRRDNGDHVFTDYIKGGQTLIEGALTGDGLQSVLDPFITELDARILRALPGAVGGGDKKYNELGYWEQAVPESITAHKGLPNFLQEPTDPKVPVIFYVDLDSKSFKIGLDADRDGKPDNGLSFATLDDAKQEHEKVVFKTRVTDDISSTLFGVDFEVEDIDDSVAGATLVVIRYGTGRGSVLYSNDAVKNFQLGPDATLEAAWTTRADERVKDFLGRPQVQEALLRVTGAYTGRDHSVVSGLMNRIEEGLKSGLNWLKNDKLENQFENEWEKAVIRKMTVLINDPVNGLGARYVNEMFRNNKYSNDAFQGKEDAFFDTERESLEHGGVVEATVEPLEAPDSVITAEEAMAMVNSEGPRGGKYRLSQALAPLQDQDPAAMASRFQSALQGISNTFTRDSVRDTLYKEKLAEKMGALRTVVGGFGLKPNRKQVEEAIANAALAAQNDAIRYYGLTDEVATQKMMLESLEAGPFYASQWKEASELVASYITQNMKWEKYAFLPNPENMAAVWNLWKAGINDAKNPAMDPIRDPKDYATYFIWNLQVHMGGKQDYSPDRFYGQVQSVSDTSYNGAISGLKSNLESYDVWRTSPKRKPRTPDMLSALDLYREKEAPRAFWEWYDSSAEVGALLKLDHIWPRIFKQTVDARFAQILTNPNGVDEAYIHEEIEDFKKFVLNESKMIFELFISDRVEAERKGHDVRKHILNKFPEYFYPKHHRNLPAYLELIRQEMQEIMINVHGGLPEGGVPYA
ncbi:MAG: hypothetical protein WC777_06170 [Candidatus Gracilibacteria bacterium]